MKYVLCPPCGTVFEENTEEELIVAAQSHAKEKHAYDLPREEVLEAMKSAETEDRPAAGRLTRGA
jgi:predicted small metal-binding protein